MTALESRRGLLWAAGAYSGGALLNIDAIPPWVPVAALLFVTWRLLATMRRIWIPNTVVRSLLALLLVAAVLAQFRTLNGLGAGTALLVVMGAIKLLETRTQRDQFIVIAAALFLLLAACLDRQNLVRAPLYLGHAWLCCVALAVVAYAPTATSANSAPTFDDRAAMRLAVRTLCFAAPLALMLFLFFPRLPGSFWALPRPDEATTGLGDTMNPGSIARLTSSYEVAFRATFEGDVPPPQERYWRGPVLHDFDGNTWRHGSGSFYRQPALEYLGPAYHYRMVLEPSSRRWWFSLDTPTGTPSSKVLFTDDYQLIAAEPVTEVTTYSLTSHTNTRSSDQLSKLGRRRETALPDTSNPRSRELAADLRSKATSDSAFVSATLDFLRTGSFRYSLTPPLLGAHPIDDFLFETREGFCGHYASAFVYLMRSAGIPARVVTGYLGGEWNPIGGYFIVRQSDAHAWAEVWLDGRGWVRIDPTSVVEPERLRRGILDLLPDAVSAPARLVWSTPWLTHMLQRWDAVNAWWNERVVRFNYDTQLNLLERLGFESPGARELAWAFAGGLIAWLSWVAWQIGRIPRGPRPDRLARAYSRLCRKLARTGVGREASQGPLAYADEIARRAPALEPVARELLMRYAELRYGRPEPASRTRDIIDFERAVARLEAAPS